mmetsp:Transcript_51906/g.118380  ORF Transcript_51906/g.118380 Transcript_51906/m.118380 type:complete len:200 (+) Transcript_51906:657-1256(+)
MRWRALPLCALCALWRHDASEEAEGWSEVLPERAPQSWERCDAREVVESQSAACDGELCEEEEGVVRWLPIMVMPMALKACTGNSGCAALLFLPPSLGASLASVAAGSVVEAEAAAAEEDEEEEEEEARWRQSRCSARNSTMIALASRHTTSTAHSRLTPSCCSDERCTHREPAPLLSREECAAPRRKLKRPVCSPGRV